ncbi:LLM class F420-dependent oxidoreductase [Mycobacterium intracellulare]|uniref:LLM class F420-dependent oxidoreductase n=1 Tax=Mycobacterium intracellulare TaxID=1767 RepID=UPI00045361D7|nr:LLM class F420-dependent oxidoreductase [Mycobacterium intracellulare]ETZ36143.1 putative F420-dependent oxidoreductase family protein [Mycobacterium intracellulare MIN_061107_1834]MCA2276901.1 LLM class F420-dependent oxidoreductase [Mycobacterium intracellulare]MCA2328560.1 LLM class F420-dependent oxidoreductase [Mycobacterium intracellulare]UEB22606.1 LLM class F420-dependent oxidoreductase [Mycobacterium intracellulare]WVL05584.1 LLM class F420-dependent oxidoreductase [Mycobacterium i
MELGVHFIDFLPGAPDKLGPTMATSARLAEQAGATMFTLADHFFQMEAIGQAQDPFLEGYTSLGFLAGQTEKITLSLLVTGVTYRYPGLLAKIVSTLDALSQGRSMLGLGAAWYEREHLALGVPYPPLRRRFEMLEETLQICTQMWSDNDGPYAGRHYQLAETICQPQPIRRPPILIGGDGEKKTLRMVAQYADVWNSNAATPAEVKHKVEVLQRHCEEIGRDPGEIRKTLMIGPQFDPFGDPTSFMNAMQGFAEAGIELINIAALPGNPDPIGFVSRLGDEVIPKLALLG